MPITQSVAFDLNDKAQFDKCLNCLMFCSYLFTLRVAAFVTNKSVANSLSVRT